MSTATDQPSSHQFATPTTTNTTNHNPLPKPPHLIKPIPIKPDSATLSHPAGPRQQPTHHHQQQQQQLSPKVLLSSPSSSQSSLSSLKSKKSHHAEHHPPPSSRSINRTRTDSFFGIDPIHQLDESPQSTILPQPTFHLSKDDHEPILQKEEFNKPHSDPTSPSQPFDLNLRPSSFYGLQVNPSAQRLQQDYSNHHYRSSGTNSPSSSSLPADPSDPQRQRQSSSLSISRSAQQQHHLQQRQSSRLSSIPHPQDNLLHDPNHSSNLPPPGPLLDHSHLKPGNKAKLLNHAQTLELYRANAKKTNDPEVMFEFGCFLMDLVKEMNSEDDEDCKSLDGQVDLLAGPKRRSTFEPSSKSSSHESCNTEREKEKASLTQEALFLLQKLANRGHVQSQFLLADCYTKGISTGGPSAAVALQQLGQGLGTDPSSPPGRKGLKADYERAFPLFVLAAKHGHVEAMYRAGQCCEHGWGTRRERDKALQFYRKAAIAQHPLAMYRLGLADLNGDLGYPRRPKDGVKWLKRAAELADAAHPNPLHELALLHERGLEHVVFVDYDYAVELLARAAELGYAPSAYKLGECYEYGRMGCPQDAALSIHYYNIAAQQNHKEACFALTAWYLVGSPGVLPQSDTEAYLWAKKAAEAGLAKAEYAVGYFTEVGVGTTRDEREALRWFQSAAEHGDKRAMERLRNLMGGNHMIKTIDIEDESRRSKEVDRKKKRASRSSRGGGNEENFGQQPLHKRLDPVNFASNRPDPKKGSKEDCIIM